MEEQPVRPAIAVVVTVKRSVPTSAEALSASSAHRGHGPHDPAGSAQAVAYRNEGGEGGDHKRNYSSCGFSYWGK